MGQVKVFVELENSVDKENCISGLISEDKVRTCGIEALVDTGAVMLMLPQDIVEGLGLRELRKAVVTYANEHKEERPIAGPVWIKVGKRSMHTECVVGPLLSEPLIGQIILEALDLIVDCQRQTLGPRPESPIYPLLKLK